MMKFRGALVVLVLILALIIGCHADLPELKPPAGMVSLNFNDTISRTILPDQGGLENFSVFHIKFTNTTAGNTETDLYVPYPIPVANPPRSVQLEVGSSYDITAVGYLSSGTFVDKDTAPGSLEEPAGVFTQNGFVVTAAPSTITITLRAFTTHPDFTDGGSFSWALTNKLSAVLFPAESTITITGENRTLDPPQPYSDVLSFSWNGKEPLPVGYYDVEFHLVTSFAKSPYNRAPIDFHHVLHVYQNWDSHFVLDVTDSLTDLPDVIIIGGGGDGGLFDPEGLLGQGLITNSTDPDGDPPYHDNKDTDIEIGENIHIRFPDGVEYYPGGNGATISDTHINNSGNSGGDGTIRIYPLTGPYWVTVYYSGNVQCRITRVKDQTQSGTGDLIPPESPVPSAPYDEMRSHTVYYDGSGSPDDACVVIGFWGSTNVQIYDIVVISARP